MDLVRGAGSVFKNLAKTDEKKSNFDPDESLMHRSKMLDVNEDERMLSTVKFKYSLLTNELNENAVVM